MKKALITVLVMALLAGAGYIGITASASAADNGSSSRGAAYDTVLITIAEGVTLGSAFPGNGFMSDYINVENYRNFKLYACMTPGPDTFPPPDPPNVLLSVNEHPLGEGPNYARSIPPGSWIGMPLPPEESRWTMVLPFDGLYSNLQVSVLNMSAFPPLPPPDPPVPPKPVDITVDIYLLMAKE